MGRRPRVRLAADDRPALLEALSHIRDADTLTVQEVDRLGRNLLDGPIVLKSRAALLIRTRPHELNPRRRTGRCPHPSCVPGHLL
ncbi:recombinase family protein [Nonomuraea sp. NPDC049400]|uniref:recombinase family protein n=1 Tax=Nonomuraea sp. NPDC049400 TaxID=3364352 RepID=UPI0037911D32